MVAKEKSGYLLPFSRFYLTHPQKAIPRNFTQIQFGSTCKTPSLRRARKFAILQIRPEATPHTAWPRNQFYKESNSSGCSGRPHGNGSSDWAFRVHCIPEAYIHTLMGCDAHGTPNITDRFSCGLPSTKHSLLIPVFASCLSPLMPWRKMI